MSIEAPLPRLSPEEFNTALQAVRRTAKGYTHNHSRFATSLIKMESFQDAPGMNLAFLAVVSEAKICAALNPGNNHTDIFYGASVMFLLLHTLGKPFVPKISETIVETHISERTTYLRRLVKNFETTDPDDVGEILGVMDTTAKNTGYTPFTSSDLYRENPAFEPWMRKMNDNERLGATTLYGVVRRQAAADKLNNLWGEDE